MSDSIPEPSRVTDVVIPVLGERMNALLMLVTLSPRFYSLVRSAVGWTRNAIGNRFNHVCWGETASVQAALSVAGIYILRICNGQSVPHPRFRLSLAQLVRVLPFVR